jgi:hypothetical protein
MHGLRAAFIRIAVPVEAFLNPRLLDRRSQVRGPVHAARAFPPPSGPGSIPEPEHQVDVAAAGSALEGVKSLCTGGTFSLVDRLKGHR